MEQAVHGLPEHMWSMFDRYIPMVVPAYATEEVRLEENDMIVFCSDGVSDYVGAEEMIGALREGGLGESIRTVVNAAKENAIRERGCLRYDDLTMLVYRH